MTSSPESLSDKPSDPVGTPYDVPGTSRVATATGSTTSRTEPGTGLDRFNGSADSAAVAALHEVCASAAWGRELLARRPYPTAEALLATSDAAVARLTEEDLAEAVAGHPPIGRPRPGDPTAAREQRGMAAADSALKAEMLELNLAYQARFGHVFLICATGLSGAQMRDAVRARLANPPRRERAIVRTELGRINRIRLTRLLATETTEVTEATVVTGVTGVTEVIRTNQATEFTGATRVTEATEERPRPPRQE